MTKAAGNTCVLVIGICYYMYTETQGHLDDITRGPTGGATSATYWSPWTSTTIGIY